MTNSKHEFTTRGMMLAVLFLLTSSPATAQDELEADDTPKPAW